MNGLSINNLNSGNIAYNGYSSQNKEDLSANSGSFVSKVENMVTPPEPFDVIEPLEFDNPFENPFDFSSISLPFEITVPEDITNPFSIEMPIEIAAPEIPYTEGATDNNTTVMEPYTYGDGGASKAALSGKKVTNDELQGKYKCSTCESRKYVDGSTDPGVSFKTPTKVGKESAHSAVAAHERQHVTRNQAKAEREGREVVSQTVTYHSGVCPECGDVYTAGGTTTTVTKAKQENNSGENQRKKMMDEMSFSFEI